MQSHMRITFFSFLYVMAKIVPAMQLAAHAKSSTLHRLPHGVKSKFLLTWWVTTILYNYGATLCVLYMLRALLLIASLENTLEKEATRSHLAKKLQNNKAVICKRSLLIAYKLIRLYHGISNKLCSSSFARLYLIGEWENEQPLQYHLWYWLLGLITSPKLIHHYLF